MVSPGDEVVFLEPSFAMIEVFNKTFQALEKPVVFGESRSIHIDQIKKQISPKTKLLVLPNPNNPTGLALPVEDLKQLALSLAPQGAMLLVDEAYYHYCEITAQSLIKEHSNVVVTRTFSKGWGLAGIRLGYIMTNEENISLFRKLKPIDESSTFSLLAANFCLKNPSYLENNVQQVRKWQKKFGQWTGEDISYVPSEANFILLKISERLHSTVKDWFLSRKILIKSEFPNACMKNLIRFSVSDDETMEAIFNLLELKGQKIDAIGEPTRSIRVLSTEP